METFPGNNQPSIPVERLYELCHHVLQFVSLDRNGVFKSLLVSTTQCASPSEEQRYGLVVWGQMLVVMAKWMSSWMATPGSCELSVLLWRLVSFYASTKGLLIRSWYIFILSDQQYVE